MSSIEYSRPLGISGLVFVPRIKTVLDIIIHYRTKHIPVSHVSLCKLVPVLSPCQQINTLVDTNYIHVLVLVRTDQ